MTVMLLIEHPLEFLSLKRGCTGLSESTLFKMQDCWKSHVAAQLCDPYQVTRTVFQIQIHRQHIKVIVRKKNQKSQQVQAFCEEKVLTP